MFYLNFFVFLVIYDNYMVIFMIIVGCMFVLFGIKNFIKLGFILKVFML